MGTLHREFKVLGMIKVEPITNYFTRTFAIANKMTSHGKNMAKILIVKRILWSMGEKFERVMCPIEGSNGAIVLSLNKLK